MKKITFLIPIILISCCSYAQIPSIKQANRSGATVRVSADLSAYFERRDSINAKLDKYIDMVSKENFDTLSEDEVTDSIANLREQRDLLRQQEIALENDLRYLKIKQNKYKADIERLEKELEREYDAIEQEDIGFDDTGRLTTIKLAIADKEELLKGVEKDIARVAKKNTAPYFFPSSYKKHKESFYNMLYSKEGDKDFYFVNNAALQINDNANTIESELASAFLGAWRISFGTLISNSTNNQTTTDESGEQQPEQLITTDDTEAFQRLLAGGGNVFLNAELPVLFVNEGAWVGYLNAYGKGSVDFAEISNDIDTSTANGAVGANFYTSVSTDKNEFNFFANVNYGMYFGGDQFYNALNLEEKPFGFGQLIVGVTVYNRFRFSFTTNTFGSDEALRSGNVVFGIQVLSGFFEN